MIRCGGVRAKGQYMQVVREDETRCRVTSDVTGEDEAPFRPAVGGWHRRLEVPQGG